MGRPAVTVFESWLFIASVFGAVFIVTALIAVVIDYLWGFGR